MVYKRKNLQNYSFNYNKSFYEDLKEGENDFKIAIDRQRYNLVRLDGASFSKQFKLRYARFARKLPYNPYLVFAMQQTALDAMKEFPFISYAYSFSDEITFLIDNSLIDFRKMSTLEKMISILSSFVSSAFNTNLYRIIDLKVDELLTLDGKIDFEKIKIYQQFFKNSIYLLNVAKKNKIPLAVSGVDKSEEIENIYKIFKNDIPKRVKKEELEQLICLINKEMPFSEYKNHIFYFDARLISYEIESKVYQYFKSRQCFAIYKFVEDLALSLIENPVIFQGNKTTNMYFKMMHENGIPSSVYTLFDDNLKFGTSYYKDSANSITTYVAKELREEDDEKLIETISNMLDEDSLTPPKKDN